MEPEPEPQPEAEPRGALREHRPAWLQGAASEMFEEQATAGESLVYGAVGDTDYIIEAGAGVDKSRAWSVMDVVAAMRQREPSRAIRVLDIGTGDGKLLWELHRRFGLPWDDLVGVTAEDMRGVKTRPDKEPFDLREAVGGAASDASYIVWNAERLDECPALRGRSFDLIVSWMTFCWLADPLGTLEHVFDEFLAPHGLLVAGGIQMLTEQAEVVEDLQFLSALRERLRAEGRRCDVFADAGQRWFSWWLLRKSSEASERLNLYPIVRYGKREDESNKVMYTTELKLGAELSLFDPAEVTVL